MLVWVIVLATAAALLVARGYRTRDPDSRAYIAITTHLATEPSSRWIAPQWWGAWGLQGLFRDHPVGTFVAPALLARAGYPVAQSLFEITLAAQVGCLLLMTALASRFIPVADARALAWVLQLLPIAFVFRVRANQEYLLLFGLLLTLYGLERARAHAGWIVVAVAGFVYALLVKGVFALLELPLAVLWLVARRRAVASAGKAPWIGVAVLCALVPVVAWGYERAYVSATGQSFLTYYLGPRLSLNENAAGTGLPFLVDKAANALWYMGLLLWFAGPWSAVLLAGIWVRRLRARREHWAVAVFAVGAAVITVALMAMRDNVADRYIFPAYYFAAAGGFVVALVMAPRLPIWTARLERTWPWGPALFWLVLTASRILVG
jgi:4-amino-4-deoxy-L-arabinose transferase-like glycosyltransferase